MTDRLWASLMFFTRLPFWRIRQVDAECFKHVVDYWPFAGWLTGGTAALVFWLVSGILPIATAALAAIGTRLWLTGALHEDGLADFCDGFGGGTTRERTLAIMKDSHIGTYGVLGLVFYIGLLISLISALPLCGSGHYLHSRRVCQSMQQFHHPATPLRPNGGTSQSGCRLLRLE